jgi:hypothetical protein
MPLFIFIPSEAAIGGALFGTPLAPFDSEGHIPINSNIVFGISATGTVIFDYSSLIIKINNVDVVTAGIPTAGYSLSLARGQFYNTTGLILTLTPPANLSTFTTYTIDALFNTINLKEYSMHYTFTTSDRLTFNSNFLFGNTNLNRYYFDYSFRENSQSIGSFATPSLNYNGFNLLERPASSTKMILQADSVAGIPDVLNEEFGTFSHVVATRLGDDINASNGLTEGSVDEQRIIYNSIIATMNTNKGDTYSQKDARTAESQGQPTPFPTMLGPRFGAKVLDRQVESLKIQKRTEDA